MNKRKYKILVSVFLLFCLTQTYLILVAGAKKEAVESVVDSLEKLGKRKFRKAKRSNPGLEVRQQVKRGKKSISDVQDDMIYMKRKRKMIKDMKKHVIRCRRQGGRQFRALSGKLFCLPAEGEMSPMAERELLRLSEVGEELQPQGIIRLGKKLKICPPGTMEIVGRSRTSYCVNPTKDIPDMIKFDFGPK